MTTFSRVGSWRYEFLSSFSFGMVTFPYTWTSDVILRPFQPSLYSSQRSLDNHRAKKLKGLRNFCDFAVRPEIGKLGCTPPSIS
jgi:hypothetical protein